MHRACRMAPMQSLSHNRMRPPPPGWVPSQQRRPLVGLFAIQYSAVVGTRLQAHLLQPCDDCFLVCHCLLQCGQGVLVDLLINQQLALRTDARHWWWRDPD